MGFENFGPFKYARLGSQALQELVTGLDHLIAGRLWLKILVSLFLGLIFGLLVGPEFKLVPPDWSESIVSWLSLPGQLFLGLIQLVIIPLVFASVILGIVSSDSVSQLKSLGIRLGVYYTFTTIVAVSIGFGVAFLLKPARFINPKLLDLTKTKEGVESISEFNGIRSIGRPVS